MNQTHPSPETTAQPWTKVRAAVNRAVQKAHHRPDQEYDRYPRWPVVLLAASAFVAIWGGWVDLGKMAGFGPVNLLPGIASLYVDLSITLPLGMEVYSAYALGVWLTHRRIRPEARRFAGWSVLVSLVVGAGGQVAYHLLSAAGVERAPWQVVVVVACVPVAVMGMGAALAHLLTVGHSPAAVDDVDADAAVDAPAGAAAEAVTAAVMVQPAHAAVQAAARAAHREGVTVHTGAAAGPLWTTKSERDHLIRQVWTTERQPDGDRLTHQEIADRVGTSKSTVTRALNQAEDEQDRHAPAVQAERFEWAEAAPA